MIAIELIIGVSQQLHELVVLLLVPAVLQCLFGNLALSANCIHVLWFDRPFVPQPFT